MKFIKFKKLAHIFGFIWIYSIVIFFGYAYFSIPESGGYSYFQNLILTSILIIGAISFLLSLGLYFVYFLRNRKKEQNHIKKEVLRLHTNPFFYGLIVLLLLLGLVYLKGTVLLNQENHALEQVKIEPNVVISTPPVSIKHTQSAIIQPTVDSDPIVNCGPGVNSKQYVKDRSSNCKNYVDCGLNDNVWTMMLKSDCDAKHEEQNSQKINNTQPPPTNNTLSKVAVFLSYGSFTKYCPPQNVAAVQSINSTMESKKSIWDTNFNTCYKSHQDSDICYMACKAGPINDYATCIATCPTFVDACQYNYSERQSLWAQIDNLCSNLP